MKIKVNYRLSTSYHVVDALKTQSKTEILFKVTCARRVITIKERAARSNEYKNYIIFYSNKLHWATPKPYTH